MRLANAVRTHYHDIRRLGPGILRRHVDARRKRPLTHVRLRRYGNFTLRPNTSDYLVVRDVLADDQYDLSRFPQNAVIEAAYDEIVADGRTPLIIDLGANIGASARWFCRRYPRAHIIAVEPDESNAELCALNTMGCDVEVLTAAIGSRPGAVSVHGAGGDKWAVSTERDEHGTTPIRVVNDLVSSATDAALFIVKVDIEGFESDLFESNTEWVEQATLVVIEPHDWMLPDSATSRAFQRLFGSLDYDLLIRGENLAYVRRRVGLSGTRR